MATLNKELKKEELMDTILALFVVFLFCLSFLIVLEFFMFHKSIFSLFMLDKHIDDLVYKEELDCFLYQLYYKKYSIDFIYIDDIATIESFFVIKRNEKSVVFPSLTRTIIFSLFLNKKYTNFMEKVIERINMNRNYIPKTEVE